MIEPSSSRLPSISAWTSVPMRSSDWLSRRRCSATAVMYSAYSMAATAADVHGRRDPASPGT